MDLELIHSLFLKTFFCMKKHLIHVLMLFLFQCPLDLCQPQPKKDLHQ
jgi:hypothetical protein